MRRNALLLGAYIRRHFLAWTAGWSFAVTIYLSRLVMPLIGLALWTKAVPDDPRVALYYVAMVFAVMATDSPENHTFAQRVYDGTFTDDLLRPHPVPMWTIGFNIAFKAFNVLGAIPIAIFVAVATDVYVDWDRVLIALPALALGSAIAFVLIFTLAQSSFWTPRVHAVTQFGAVVTFMLGGGAAPVPFLPEPVRRWLMILPFRAITGFPCEIVSGLVSGDGIRHGYGLQVAWLVALAAVSRRVWVAGLKRYVAVGG